ncbi:unnamed protein product [Mycetohabitans rhizoxinica HKI 454]|uniref:Uncharacterized protein n=1 Tax=Mycetohabitans rhizoxinica (strain DSM 19002 / CIP 109453 / HKI 454) TaxID=882378 RepID=E5AS56_MYCRK|nr:unnamed protein product [Mycetohabitans rhizoxinica HKI 454]
MATVGITIENVSIQGFRAVPPGAHCTNTRPLPKRIRALSSLTSGIHVN